MHIYCNNLIFYITLINICSSVFDLLCFSGFMTLLHCLTLCGLFYLLFSLQLRFIQFKGTVPHQNQQYIFFLVPVVLFVHPDCFGVSCRVLQMSAVGASALS